MCRPMCCCLPFPCCVALVVLCANLVCCDPTTLMGLCQPCGANDEIRDEGRVPYICREAAHPRGSFACPFASVLEVNALLKTSSEGCSVQHERGVRIPMYSRREETQYASAFVPQHRKRAINALSWAKPPPWYPHRPSESSPISILLVPQAKSLRIP